MKHPRQTYAFLTALIGALLFAGVMSLLMLSSSSFAASEWDEVSACARALTDEIAEE